MNLMNKIVGKISRVLANIRFKPANKGTSERKVRELLKLVQAGDVIATKTNGYIGNLFLGKYGHVIMCAGDVLNKQFKYEGEHLAIESTTEKGVHISNLLDVLQKKDRICLMRPLFLDDEQKRGAVIRFHSMVGKPYDFEFSSTLEGIYCSEGIGLAYDSEHWQPRMRFGQMTYSPMDYYNAKNKFSKLLEF